MVGRIAAGVASMMEARRKAGERAAADRAAAAPRDAAPPSVIACAPAPPGATVTVREPRRDAPVLPPAGELAALIREELERALRK